MLRIEVLGLVELFLSALERFLDGFFVDLLFRDCALGEHVAERFGIEAEFIDVPNPV